MGRFAFLSGFQFFFGKKDEQAVSEHQAKVVFSEPQSERIRRSLLQGDSMCAKRDICRLYASISIHVCCQSEGV